MCRCLLSVASYYATFSITSSLLIAEPVWTIDRGLILKSSNVGSGEFCFTRTRVAALQSSKADYTILKRRALLWRLWSSLGSRALYWVTYVEIQLSCALFLRFRVRLVIWELLEEVGRETARSFVLGMRAGHICRQHFARSFPSSDDASISFCEKRRVDGHVFSGSEG